MSYPPVPPANGIKFTKTLHADTYPAIDSAKSNHKGRSVFITGGSRGIGRATAISVAKAGASHIAIGAPDSFEGLEQDLYDAAKSAGHTAPQVLLLNLDVLDRSTVASAAKEVEAFGKLDILINNTGFMTPAKPVIKSDEEEYWKTFEINVRGVYRVTKAFLPILLKSEAGLKTIVNLSSVAAHNLRLHASAYGTTKFAILRFTEFLLLENPGLLAYCVHPGAIMTRLAEAMPEETHAGEFVLSLEVENEVVMLTILLL